jgi:hypothetical protein
MTHRWFLGTPPRIPIPGNEGWAVHIGTSLHAIVAFIGFADQSSPTGIRCEGTGFFLFYKGAGYLITARHVAVGIGEDPFVIRVNRRGAAVLVAHDLAKWMYHPDELVDLAAIPIALPTGHGFECVYLEEEAILTKDRLKTESIDVGALCYTVGLFHYIQGQKRNLPMAHAGNIALMPPPGETIPVWNKDKKRVDFVEGYLIETVAINGASGSPVFARPSITVGPFKSDQGQEFRSLWPEAKVPLLGLFQGAWFAPPDDPVARNVQASPDKVIVPVGVGIVVPAYKIVELLETDEMKEYRAKTPPLTAARQTSTVSATKDEEKVAQPAKATNPNHREDFNRLLGAAVRPPKSSD